MGLQRHLARRNVLALDSALEDLERGERLVERHFVAALVDPHKAESAGLLDLAVGDVVGRDEVRVPGAAEAARVDFVCNHFAAQPVAVVVGVAGVHGDGYALREESGYGFDGAVFAVVVAGEAEIVAYEGRVRGEVLVGADCFLDLGGV